MQQKKQISLIFFRQVISHYTAFDDIYNSLHFVQAVFLSKACIGRAGNDMLLGPGCRENAVTKNIPAVYLIF